MYNLFIIVENSGEKLEGISVTIDDEMYTTDGNGAIVLNGIQSTDTIHYSIYEEGYVDISALVTVVDENTVVTIPLEHIIYELLFTVSSNNETLNEAMITIDGFTPQFTNEQGVFIFEYTSALDIDTLHYSIELDGYESEVGSIFVQMGGMGIDAELERMTYQVVFVIDDGTEPLANAAINFGTYGEIWTDEDGKVIFSSVVSDDFDYVVSLDGYTTNEGTISVSEDVEVQVTLVLETSNLDLLHLISVYPVPVKDILTIENAEGYQLKVYEISGRLVYESFIKSSKENINFSGLKSGNYTLKIGEKLMKIAVVK